MATFAINAPNQVTLTPEQIARGFGDCNDPFALAKTSENFNAVLQYIEDNAGGGGGGVTSFTGLTDTPANFTNSAGKMVVVNEAGTALEFVDITCPLIVIENITADKTLALGDVGKYIRINSPNANTISIPENAVTPIPIGAEVTIRQVGDGQTTFVGLGAVVVNSAESLSLRKIGSTATLVKVAADEWDLMGDLQLGATPVDVNGGATIN